MNTPHAKTPQWLGSFTRGAVRLALDAPAWVPRWLRRAPLNACLFAMRVQGGYL